MKTNFLCLLSLFISTLTYSGTDFRPQSAKLKQTMQRVDTLLADIFSSLDGGHGKIVPATLKNLEELSHLSDAVRDHVLPKPELALLGHSLSQDAHDAYYWYKNNQPRETVFILSHMRDLCSQCHNKFGVLRKTDSSSLKIIPGEAITLARKLWDQGKARAAYDAYEQYLKRHNFSSLSDLITFVAEVSLLSWQELESPVLGGNMIKKLLFLNPDLASSHQKWLTELANSTFIKEPSTRNPIDARDIILYNPSPSSPGFINLLRISYQGQISLNSGQKNDQNEIFKLALIKSLLPSSYLNAKAEKDFLGLMLRKDLSPSIAKEISYFYEQFILRRSDELNIHSEAALSP